MRIHRPLRLLHHLIPTPHHLILRVVTPNQISNIAHVRFHPGKAVVHQKMIRRIYRAYHTRMTITKTTNMQWKSNTRQHPCVKRMIHCRLFPLPLTNPVTQAAVRVNAVLIRSSISVPPNASR